VGTARRELRCCEGDPLRNRVTFSVGAEMNENFSLIVMCFFLLASLAFLAEQLTAYH